MRFRESLGLFVLLSVVLLVSLALFVELVLCVGFVALGGGSDRRG